MKIGTIVAVSALTLAAGGAWAGTYVVPGTSDPFLAGAPSGASVDFGGGIVDSAPADSPVGIAVTAGQKVTISNVTGTVSNGPGIPANGPTGGGGISSSAFTPTGFTELVAGYSDLPINSLVGVFLTPGGGDQVFEVGNGGTLIAPVGTTKFYLATVDGFQWSNNSGAFTATVAVPEPAAWAMMLLGLGGIGVALRSRRRQSGLSAAA
ncbi:MAG TPA: PEPxxWA-CTERM sorting domain-containing protein [Caulobacteraceae bacterium]